MENRKALFQAEDAMPAGFADLRSVIYVLAANLSIVAYFSYAIFERSKDPLFKVFFVDL